MIFTNFGKIKMNRSKSLWKVAIPKSSYSVEIQQKTAMVKSIFTETVV